MNDTSVLLNLIRKKDKKDLKLGSKFLCEKQGVYGLGHSVIKGECRNCLV